MTTVSMQAMVLDKPGVPLELKTLPVPVPAAGQVLIKVAACGVCRTDLHILDGDLPRAAFPIIPGHEIVGEVVELGEGVTLLRRGDKVGVPWFAYVCKGGRIYAKMLCLQDIP